MAVSLKIRRADGQLDSYPFSGQGSAEEVFRPLAQSLNLKHVPLFPAWYPIEADYLAEVIDELHVLHSAVKERHPEWTSFPEDLTHIIVALEELKGQKGWKASFG